MVLRQEAFNQICVHKGLCVFKEKQAKPLECGLVVKKASLVMCRPFMHILNIFKCEHVFLLKGHKKSVALDVSFFAFCSLLRFCGDGVDSRSDNGKAGARSAILITGRFNSQTHLVVNSADAVALKLL